MDIVKKVRPLVSYQNLSLKNHLAIAIFLVSAIGIIVPHLFQVHAEVATGPRMVFVVGDYDNYLTELDSRAVKLYNHEQTVMKLKMHLHLADRVEEYLRERNSPLANHVDALLQQNNWKKIIALSNAESSMCRRYPVATNNCWGVGGSDLWTMGENLDQGVVAMNRFLNNYPLRSKVKYAQMPFEDMNGLYKQPARDHWLYNNTHIYSELTALENKLAQR